MTRRDVEEALIDAMSEFVAGLGGPVPKIGGRTRPFAELPEFDSHAWLEVELTLSERLGREIKDVLSPGAMSAATITVSEIVELLCGLLLPEGANRE